VFERLPFAPYHSEHLCEHSCWVSGRKQQGNELEKEINVCDICGRCGGRGGGHPWHCLAWPQYAFLYLRSKTENMCKYYFTICLPRSSLQCFVTRVPATVSLWVQFREWSMQLRACRCLIHTRCIWMDLPNIKWNAFLRSICMHLPLTEHKIYLQYDHQPVFVFNPLKAELNAVCHLLTLLGTHHILHISRIRVKGNNRCFLWKLFKAHKYFFIYFSDHASSHSSGR